MTTSVNSIGCVDAAARIISEKWTPQLLRCLANSQLVGFCQLQAAAGNINPRTLSARLTVLEKNNIIVKSDPKTNRPQYSLTKKGSDLLPIIRSMQQWSDKYTPATVA